MSSNLVEVKVLKQRKMEVSSERVLDFIDTIVRERYMKDSSIFIADSVFSDAGCDTRSFVYNELKEKGYMFTEVEPCRGEEGGIVISGW